MAYVMTAIGLAGLFILSYWMYRTGYKDGYNDYREGHRKRFMGQSWRYRSEL
jgi:hypothetical protein